MITRREFLAATAAAATPWWRFEGRSGPSVLLARPFELGRVRLRGGPFLEAAEVNRRFLVGLDHDRLLHMFRVTAGLPSSADPLGGWEAPNNELRGHFVGHYLSACALVYASLGDNTLKDRGERLVRALRECQRPTGYLSAFPEEFFDRLRAGARVWAPFYTIHKIMAGLLDMHTLCSSEEALKVVVGMAEWTARWVGALDAAGMRRVLDREFGGMNEVLYNLAEVTGNHRYRDVASCFDDARVFGPLAEGRDELKGLHANTTIPKIIGSARAYELTGSDRYRRIAEFFWRQVALRRSYCTGGTSNEESWRTDPAKLAAELGGYTQECCCTYNMLKLSRHVFSWSADPRCADYMERALFGGILGTQHPSDGSKLYYVPLGSGYWKLFGTPLQDFWCCTGSGSESFARLTETIYFHDDSGMWVNQFVPSEVEWREKGLSIVQETAFPEEEKTTLVIRCKAPVSLALRLRIPYWASRGGRVRLNGKLLDRSGEPGSYFVLESSFRDGDRVELELPMALHLHAMPDDPSLQAVMYGPLVLVGRLGTEGLRRETLRAGPTPPRTVPEYTAPPVPAPPLRLAKADPDTWFRRLLGRLEFQTVGQETDLTFVPLHTLFDERYAVYWRVSEAATISELSHRRRTDR